MVGLFAGGLYACKQFNLPGNLRQRHFLRQLADKLDDCFSTAHVEIVRHCLKKCK